MFGLGPAELIVIAVILIFLFGAKRIPEIGKGLGGVIREFRTVRKELRGDETGQKDIEGKETVKEEKTQNNMEEKLKKKMIDNVPVIKKASEFNDKVNKIKDIIN